MSNIPSDLKYTKDHEWARVSGNLVVVGITDYAQGHLGDVVMVELPKVGQGVTAHKAFGSVESPKSVSDLFAPVSGKVTRINSALDDNPEKVNSDCYGDGWICEIEASDMGELGALLDAEHYTAFLATLDA